MELVRHAQLLSISVFVTGNKGVHDKVTAGPKLAQITYNCDLYYGLFQMLDSNGIHLTIRWMPSHLSPDDPRPDDVSLEDIIGNKAADRYAGEAAKLVQVPLRVASDCRFYYRLVKYIQMRTQEE